MRLDKYLSNSGVGSRTEVRRLIRDGQVRVNHQVVKDPAFDVSENDVVECSGQRVEPFRHVYVVVHKPAGYVCDRVDDANVFDLLNEPWVHRLHVAGRLDRDVEGVVILTSDGWFTHLLIDPKSRLEREYLIYTDGKLTDEMKHLVAAGIKLGEEKFAPAKIEEVADGLVRIVLTEGKYHEVKKILRAIGLNYKKIVRTRFENITIENLSPGQYRNLTQEEIKLIVEIAKKRRTESRSSRTNERDLFDS